jgi:plasmid stabilization system protein ParE
MPNYELAEAAEEDLKGIALYTVSKWGPKTAVRYGALLVRVDKSSLVGKSATLRLTA